MTPSSKKNQEHLLTLGRTDYVVLAISGCLGMALVYAATKSWLLTILIGFNCGANGPQAVEPPTGKGVSE